MKKQSVYLFYYIITPKALWDIWLSESKIEQKFKMEFLDFLFFSLS